MSTPSEPIDSATVVIVRDHRHQLEVLLLKKNASINYGGTWVFPGGVLEPNDDQLAVEQLACDTPESAAKVAAVRETKEESGIELAPGQLHSFAHWTTPILRSKRYATWFFIADGNQLKDEITIDDGEIVEARWFTPEQALTAQATDEIQLTGPSFVTLSELSDCNDVSQVIEFYRTRELSVYKPRVVVTAEAFISLYQDDSAYHLIDQAESLTVTSKPPLHRLYMKRTGAWDYVKLSS